MISIRAKNHQRWFCIYKIKQGPIWKHYPVWIFVFWSHYTTYSRNVRILKLLLIWMAECLSSFGFLVWGIYKIATFKPKTEHIVNGKWYLISVRFLYEVFFVVFLRVFKRNRIHTIGFFFGVSNRIKHMAIVLIAKMFG